jgi:hypothetical protein
MWRPGELDEAVPEAGVEDGSGAGLGGTHGPEDEATVCGAETYKQVVGGNGTPRSAVSGRRGGRCRGRLWALRWWTTIWSGGGRRRSMERREEVQLGDGERSQGGGGALGGGLPPAGEEQMRASGSRRRREQRGARGRWPMAGGARRAAERERSGRRRGEERRARWERAASGRGRARDERERLRVGGPD